MASSLVPAQSPPPNRASSVSTRRNKFFPPLSNHGLPKPPPPTSPGGSFRSHRFSTMRSPISPTPSSPPMAPMVPMAPMSPPMSAKSFGTFIESEPSTPAYSPRAGMSNWDSSTLVLLSPAPSVPSSPPEPEWEMMTPIKKANKSTHKNKTSSKFSKGIFPGAPVSSHPVKPIREEPQKENLPPTASETAADSDSETKVQEEQSSHAPLGKLATRMKSILRRKTASEKKEGKRRRDYQDLDRMEDVHWTEM